MIVNLTQSQAEWAKLRGTKIYEHERKLAEEVWDKIFALPIGSCDPMGERTQRQIDFIASYGKTQYKAGIEAMRDKMKTIFVNWGRPIDVWSVQLLEDK